MPPREVVVDVAELAATRRESELELDAIEWTEPSPAPALTAPATQSEFYCRDETTGELIEAGKYFRRICEARLADPAWWEEQRLKRAARNQARLDRIAERRKRKGKVHETLI